MILQGTATIPALFCWLWCTVLYCTMVSYCDSNSNAEMCEKRHGKTREGDNDRASRSMLLGWLLAITMMDYHILYKRSYQHQTRAFWLTLAFLFAMDSKQRCSRRENALPPPALNHGARYCLLFTRKSYCGTALKNSTTTCALEGCAPFKNISRDHAVDERTDPSYIRNLELCFMAA